MDHDGHLFFNNQLFRDLEFLASKRAMLAAYQVLHRSLLINSCKEQCRSSASNCKISVPNV